MDKPYLETIDVCHHYNDIKVLNTINLKLYANEVIALLGINGAGKSSLLNIITGIIIPSEGEVLIHDKNLFKSSYLVKKDIGYLSENNPLYEDMYVREYLQFIARLYLSNSIEIRSRIFDIIDQTGLKNEYKKKISVLSKGNRQRVGIAQALVHNPKIIILDEPMNGLDVHQQDEIKKLIFDLKQDRLILLSSHHFSETENLATRYIILHNGELVFDKHANMVSDNMYNIFNTLTQ